MKENNMLIKWTVLNIGAISRNRFWGEDDSRPYRKGVVCTSTVIVNGADVIVVDPPVAGEEMERLLDFRCGLKVGDVTKVFATHSHGDHIVGMECFPAAEWLMPQREFEAFKASGHALAAKFKPAGDEVSPGVRLLPLPGHTPGLAGLLYEAAEGRVAVVGDGAMTRDFFVHRAGYFNSVDFAEAARSIERLAGLADVVVPGHDNAFSVAAAMKR